MSAEVIYSDIKFTCRTEAHESHSAVARDLKQQDSGSHDPDRAAHLEAQVKKPGCGPVVWVPMCLCALLVGVAVSLGVLYSKQQKEDLESHHYLNKSNATENNLLKADLFQCNKNLSEALDHYKAVQDRKACPSGWDFHAGKCYYFSSDKMPWIASARSCITMGGHLVIIDSEEEQQFLLGKISTKMTVDDDKFWIGLSDAEVEGQWLWMDKTPLNESVMFWLTTGYHKEPDNWKRENKSGENCARMGERGKVNIRSWYDASCEKPFKRVCEGLAAIKSGGL